MRKHTILAAVACAAAALGAQAQGTLSPRTANILPGMSRDIGTTVGAYITVDNGAFDQSYLEEMGCVVTMRRDSILSARIPLDAAAAIASLPGVRYIQTAAPVSQMLDIARDEVGMGAVQAGTGLDMPYTGKGVVVGIVDNGFDYGHAAFRDKDGNLRIRRVWEQTGEGGEGVPYGVELTTPDQILAAGGDIRNNSHGTHVASIAAGSDSYLEGALRGMAPDADIVLVSLLAGEAGMVEVSDAVAYIFAYADEVDKPCVVNLSLGVQSGPHDGTSTFDRLADALQGPGRLLVGSAGNHRAGSFHIRKEFTAESTTMRTFIDFLTSLSASNTGGEIELWCDNPEGLQVNLLAYKTSNGDVAETVTVFPAEGEGSVTHSLGRNITGSVRAASETSPLNGKTHVSLISDITAIRTGYAVAIEVVAADGAVMDIWADNILLGLTDKGIEGFTAPAGESTIAEIGGTGRRILSVGAYTTRNTYTRLGESVELSLDEVPGELGSFSSCGPTADMRVKPDVAAPGCFISAAVSSYDNSGTQVLSHYHNNGGDNYYGFMQGTSMSAPMMAGIAAAWLEAWPEMSPEDLHEVVSQTSRVDSFTGAVPNNMWGAGKVDAYAGMAECIERSGKGGVGSVTVSDGKPCTIVRDASGMALLCLEACNGLRVTVYDTAGRMLYTEEHGNVPAMSKIALKWGSGPRIIVANGEKLIFSDIIFGN